MKKFALLGSLAFLLSFTSFAALPVESPAQEKKSLRIVFVSLSWNNQLPFRIAIAKGFFKDQGLAVENRSSCAAALLRSRHWFRET